MIKTNLFEETETHKIVLKKSNFSVLEYQKDISVSPEHAETAYFSSEMGVRKRQLICVINPESGVLAQRGIMQLMMGNVNVVTNVQGLGDLAKKFVESKVTGETGIKPHYSGNGVLVFEPTFRHVLLEDMSDWNGNLVVEDGMFLACQDSIEIKVSAQTTASSAILGGEGLFNPMLSGNGIIALESPVPREELIEIELHDDILKIDGNMAIAWSKSLKFTVERTTPTLIGSAVAGEGLVNVYKGTGKVLVAPVAHNRGISTPKTKK